MLNKVKQRFIKGQLGKNKVPREQQIGVSIGWLAGFLRRTKVVKLAPAREVEAERSKSSTKEQINVYFNNIMQLFGQHDYDMTMIANFDETYMVWGCNRWKVLTRSTNKVGVVRETKISEHVTLCGTIFGDCSTIPALAILPKVYLPNEIKFEDYPCFDWTGQKNGWIDKDIFDSYCTDVLIPQFNRRAKVLPPNKRRGLLIVDGHASRVNAALMKKFQDANIDVVILPAHTSHITQALDLCVFSVFKRNLHIRAEHKGAHTASEKRTALLTAAQLAFQTAMSHYYIKKSWRRAGIIPLDRNALLDHDCILQVPPPSFPTTEASAQKKTASFNISNSILTDRIQELEEYEEARTGPANTKKRKASTVETDAPPTKKPKRLPNKSMVTVEMDVVEEVNFARECALCGHQSTKAGRTWTQCDQCSDVWICKQHPLGLSEHYESAHPGELVPGRQRGNKHSRYGNDYLMDSDDE